MTVATENRPKNVPDVPYVPRTGQPKVQDADMEGYVGYMGYVFRVGVTEWSCHNEDA